MMSGDAETEIGSEENSEERIAPTYSLDREISRYVQQEILTNSQPTLDVYPGTAPIEYDYIGERQNPHSTNLIEATAHLVKGCLGAGLLGIHEAFMHGGIWTSLAATLVVGVIVPYTMLMLVQSAQRMYLMIRVPRLSYPDLAEAALATGPVKKLRRFSKVFRYTVDACLFIEMCGSCCLFEIMIARTLKQVLEAVSSEIKELNMSLRMYILITSVPLLCVCMIRSLKFMAPLSLAAYLFIMLCVCATLFYSISLKKNITERPKWKSFQGLFRFLGTCFYSIHGIPIALPLENSMKSPKHFITVLQCGMSAVLFLIAAVGFIGYWGFGEDCQTPITMHIPILTETLVIPFLVAFMMAITFALQFWVTFRIIWAYVGRCHKRNRGIWQRFYRAIHVVLISGVAIAFPKVNFMMTFLGAVFCAFVGFIFPAFIESLVTWREDRRKRVRWRLFKNILLVFFGSTVCGMTLYSCKFEKW
ncbi:proton-coupled amino acid transporter-like protein pathetic [Choristoneura fumiferana]|uniref:proton-coupled amino acid transporter-like protein pathetic n=1 Tax=Choristoneura fumiferana TaxID=7141 RepID=UPI003D156141